MSVRFARKLSHGFDVPGYPKAQSTVMSPLAYLESHIRRLAELYQFKDFTEVRSFIKERDFLVDLLFDASQRVGKYFEGRHNLRLEVIQDPDDGDRKLFAFILTSLPFEVAASCRDHFDDDWWLDASMRGQGTLIFDLEFL